MALRLIGNDILVCGVLTAKLNDEVPDYMLRELRNHIERGHQLEKAIQYALCHDDTHATMIDWLRDFVNHSPTAIKQLEEWNDVE